MARIGLMCGVCLVCVLGASVGCSGAAKGDESLTERPAAVKRPSLAAEARDATLMTTYDEVQVPYLGVEVMPLSDQQAQAVNDLEGALHGALLPLDSPHIPAELSASRRFTLITERGPLQVEPSRAVMMSSGASESHIFHVCDIPAGVSELKLGMIAVPYDATLPPEARVRAGQVVDASSASGKRITAYVRTLLDVQIAEARGESSAEEPFEVAELDPAAHIQIVRGRFGGGKTLLVAYAVPRALDEEDISRGHFSGLFLADEGGEAIELVLGGLSFEAARVGDLVDLEGDGVDEARFSVGYYEGNYEFLLYLKGSKHESIRLSGDGA
jgi:hypothetical protein